MKTSKKTKPKPPKVDARFLRETLGWKVNRKARRKAAAQIEKEKV